MYLLENLTAGIPIVTDTLAKKTYLLINDSDPIITDGNDIYTLTANPDQYIEVNITSIVMGKYQVLLKVE